MKATFQAKIHIDDMLSVILDRVAALYGVLERQLFVDLYVRHRSINECKKQYNASHGLTARQFNAIANDVRGKVATAKANRKEQVADLQGQIASIKKTLRKLQKEEAAVVKVRGRYKDLPPHERVERRHRICFRYHNKNRRLVMLQSRLEALQSPDWSPSICFGSKRLFHAQWHLKENGYASHEEWLKEWRDTRSDEFFCLGSKDETAGNQTCKLMPDGSLELRLPHALEEEYGKRVVIRDVKFEYGQEVLDAALADGVAISFRFLRRNGNWYVHATTERKPVDKVTNNALGAIGVDLNPQVIAVGEIDRFGNPVRVQHLPVVIQDRREEQVKATLGDAVAKIVHMAKVAQKPIIIEDLDFGQKKAQLREASDKYARMLSSFAYSTFKELLSSRAEREGVHVIKVNAAFTSVIGKVKFQSRYGLSPHTAAAVAIARRGLRFGERLRSRSALPLPVRNRGKHVWADWRRVLPAVRGRKATHGLYSIANSESQAEEIPLSVSAPAGNTKHGLIRDGLSWDPGVGFPGANRRVHCSLGVIGR